MKRIFNVLFLTILVLGLVVAQRDPKPIIRTDKVTFVSKPPTTGQVGVTYSFTAKAVSNDSTAKISYYPYQWIMTFAPVKNLFTVDSATGLFTFIPQYKGWYTFGVLARSSKGGFTTLIFSVTVTGGNGIVQGKITDTSTAGIKGVVIELLKTEMDASTAPRMGADMFGDPSVYQNSGSYWFYGITDASGNYRISGVDPGKYKIHATSPSRFYISQWYEGKTNATDANLVDVKDSIVTLVNFVLRGIAVVQPVMVSGTVTDTLNVPIKKAEVIFVNSNFALNSNTDVDDVRLFFDVNAGKTDCKLDGQSPQVIHVKVDTANGTFKSSIPPGSYIAFAKANGYITEYFQDQANLLLATKIVVQQNLPVTNINFTLAPIPPVVLGSISGNVIDTSKDAGVPSRVILTRDIWTANVSVKGSHVYVVDTDSLGAYNAGQLPPGNYYVFAVPLGSYAPAYYSIDSSNFHWKKASRVAVNGNNISLIDIYVHALSVSTSGYAGVKGTVHSFGAASAPIPGALVYASKNNQVAGYSITNASGAFTIDGLAPGSYAVSVDNLGSAEPSSSSAAVSYTSAGSPVDATINFYVSTAVTSVENNTSVLPDKFELSQNYPNPFNPSTTITYAIQQPGIVVLKVYNIVGQEVQTLVNNYQAAGKYQVSLNAQSLSSGVYFYRLQSNGSTLMRKMILLR